jgi:LmbE family N-acetylglucosaminyl deacetylase
MKCIALLVAISAFTPGAVFVTQDSGRRPVVAAVFAHPDDETIVAPILRRYAREGAADVYLVLATNGDKGTRITKIPAGEALGRARAQEARCVAERLRINPPILLDLGDGVLAVPANLRRLQSEIARVLKELRPNVVLTWGPEGLDGHPDHRIVGDVVTEIVQGLQDAVAPTLYYPGFPPDRAAAVPELPFSKTPTLDRFLTVRVPFESQDFDAAWSAFACHETQYTQEERDTARPQVNRLLNGRVYLRPAFAREEPRSDILR